MKISATGSLDLLKSSGKLFIELFKHGTLLLEVYKPDKEDLQQPHDRDEVYIVISGTGDFFNDDISVAFKPGDFLFVPAGVHHHFENFTDDFATWVIFYGPTGGETSIDP